MQTAIQSQKSKDTSWLGSPISEESSNLYIEQAIEQALREDLGENCSEDITADVLIPKGRIVCATVVCKQTAVIAGLPVFKAIFERIDPSVEITFHIEEGQVVEVPPRKLLSLEGSAQSILKAERTALNFLQRLSGVATLTKKYVSLAAPYGISILDTRKTTPGMRVFEKYATRTAGAVNHRFGLFNGIMIKDNHIAACGSITKAVYLARVSHKGQKVEVETETLAQVKEAVEAGADIIMLDNMAPEMVRSAVKLIDGKALVEVSGGITLETIANYFIPGVNGISVGAITHSAPNIDISLEIGD